MSDNPFLPLAIFLFGALLGLLTGAAVASKAWRDEAVKQGKAEYGATSTGDVMWRWKP